MAVEEQKKTLEKVETYLCSHMLYCQDGTDGLVWKLFSDGGIKFSPWMSKQCAKAEIAQRSCYLISATPPIRSTRLPHPHFSSTVGTLVTSPHPASILHESCLRALGSLSFGLPATLKMENPMEIRKSHWTMYLVPMLIRAVASRLYPCSLQITSNLSQFTRSKWTVEQSTLSNLDWMSLIESPPNRTVHGALL